MTNFKLAALFSFFAAILPAARGAEPWDVPFASDATAIMNRAAQISADSEAGVQVLLEEHRISIDASGRARGTFRKVYRILKEDSVDDWSSVQESYQPWREQKPSIRARVITKTGSVHELDLKTIADAPEEQFDASTYSDTRVVRAPLPAVEPGALVEFEIITDSGSAFPEAGITQRLQVVDEVPLEHFRVIIEAPAGAPLQTLYRQIPDSSIRKTISNGMTQIECDLGPLKARKKFEGNLPPDLSIFPYFAFSTAPSWQALAGQYAEIVERQIQSADVKALVGSIPAGASPLEVAGRLATELHRNVRYTGVEFGESAVVPARPAEVLQRKFGDCKDKSALLVAMLRAAGLKASVALLRSGFATDVDASLPGLDLFDHAIVYVDGPQPLWIDATANHARVGVLPAGDQGRFALIAARETTGLVKIPERIDTLDRNLFEVRFKDYGPGTIVETMESNGPSEMRLRSAYAASDNAKAALERYVKAAYAAKSLGEFDLAGKDDLTVPVRVKVEARDTAQVSTTIESAQVLLTAGVLTSELPYDLQPSNANTANPVAKEPDSKRVNDYLFSQAGTRQHIYKLYPPALYRAASLPQSSEVNLGPLKLTRSYKKNADGSVEVEYTLLIPKRRITGAEYNKLAEDLEKYDSQLSDRISFVPETAELLAIGQTSEALALMRENVAKNPNEAAAHMRLSRVLVSVGLGLPARSEAKRATELEPNSSQAWQTLSWAWQSDSFGRLRRGDWNRGEALKALRKAVELDPEDHIAKADLAILLEFSDTGERYGTGAALKESVALYRELLKGPGNLALEGNLASALFFDGQLDAAAEEARKCADSQRIVLEASIRALREGPGPAIVALQSAVVDPQARAQDLITLAFTFIHLRRYPDALVFAQAAGRATSLPQAASMIQLIGRFKRVEDVQFPDTDPRAVVQKFLAEVIGDAQLNRDKLRNLWVHIPDEGSSDEEVLSVRRAAIGSFQQLIELGFTTENFVDMTLSQYKLEREGDDEHGYRISPDTTIVSLSGRSSMGEMFVVRDGGSYKILDSADDLGEVGRKVLDLLKQNKIEAAQWWLDKSIPGMKTGEDGWLPAARGLWAGTVAAMRGPDAIQVTAAALIGRSQGSADAITILNNAYPKAKNAIDKGQIDLALCEAYSKAKRWADLLPVAKRLSTSKTFDSAGYQYVMKAFQAQKDWKGLENAALEETKLKTGTPDAWQYVVIARMRMGDATGAEEAIAKFKEKAAGNQAVELEVWNQILQKKVTEATLQTVQRQDGPNQVHDSYLVALVDLAMKKTEETQEALKQAVGNEDPEGMDARGWVIYGGICDQYGFPDAAAAAWEKARGAKAVTRESEWALATLGK